MRRMVVAQARRRASPVSEIRAATITYVILASGALAWWMWLGRGTTFFYDEWDFIMSYHQSLWTALTTPHVGQFVAVPILVYRAMFALFGLSHYWPYRLLGLLLELLMTTTVFFYLSKRIRPLLALIGTVAIMLCGQGFQDILWPFELTFTVSLAGGVSSLILLDLDAVATDILASLCLVVATASSGFGLVFIAGIVVGITWSSLCLRFAEAQSARSVALSLGRLWIVLPGLGMYLAWYVHAHVADAVLSRLGEVPAYVWQSAGYAVSSLLGLHDLAAGQALAGLIGLALAIRLVVGWRSASRLAMALAAALTFWVLDALARGEGAAGSSRYLQPDALLLVLCLAELATPGWTQRVSAAFSQLAARSRQAPSRALSIKAERYLAPVLPLSAYTLGVACLAIIAIAAGASNSVTLVDGASGLRAQSVLVKADLRAVELAGNRLPADLQPIPVYAPQIYVGEYLSSVASLGSPADTNAQLLGAPESARESADAILIQAMGISVHPISTNGLSTSGDSPNQAGANRDQCPTGYGRLRGQSAKGLLQLPLGAQPLIVRAPTSAPVQARLRRLAADFPSQPTFTVPTGATVAIAPRVALPNLPASLWWLQLKTAVGATIVACTSTPGAAPAKPA